MSTVAKEVDKQAEAEEKLGKSHTRFLCIGVVNWGFLLLKTVMRRFHRIRRAVS